MIEMNRRNFLKIAGSVAALGAIPESIQKALAIPANQRSGTLQDVEHIVILMQENRSFDHYFGTFNGVRGFGDPRPFPLPSGRPVWYQPVGKNAEQRAGAYANVGYSNWHKTSSWYENDPLSQAKMDYVLPFKLEPSATKAQHMESTDHNWKLSQGLWKNWDTWVPLKSKMSMAYFDTAQDMPFYYHLANAFTICDANHCSFFGNTEPNREYFTSGASVYTMTGYDSQEPNKRLHGQELDSNWTAEMKLDTKWEGLLWKSYAEQLQENNIDWRVYQVYSNYGCNEFAYFKTFRKLDEDAELYKRGRAYYGEKLPSLDDAYDELLAKALREDVENDRLPQVAWVICPDAYCEHPTATPAAGQALVDKLLAALTSNPEVWSKTVFIINYDENDGLFDHMPAYVPPVNTELYGYQGLSTVSVAEENYNGVPIGLGPRVPMLVISPWSKGGWVCSEVFDHTSVLRFIEKRFGVACDNISPWRRAICGDLTSAFDFKTPDAQLPLLPDTTNYKSEADATLALPDPLPPDVQTRPWQEVGQRRARPLPYELFAHIRVDIEQQRIWLDFANTGSSGAGFFVYDNTHSAFDESDKIYEPKESVLPDRSFVNANDHKGPWQYTLEAGKTLSDSWAFADSSNQGQPYDFSVYGPNGFLNQFKGTLPAVTQAQTQPEAALCYDVTYGNVLLTLKNPTANPLTFFVANGYDSSDTRSYQVPAGASVKDHWDLTASSQWFDLRVTTATGEGFLRRFAGHVETGNPSLTDPKMGGVAVDTL